MKKKKIDWVLVLGYILLIISLLAASFIVYQKFAGKSSVTHIVAEFYREVENKKLTPKRNEKIEEKVKLNLDELVKPIGTLIIPKINEEIPIYLEESDASLDKGAIIYARQKENIDLPENPSIKEKMAAKVESELSLDSDINKNIVLSGHSGTSISNIDIFLNIEKLVVGDRYYINDGKIVREFMIFNTEIIRPEEGRKVYKYDDKNRKLSTLYTCASPDGIRTNSHRFITHAELSKEYTLDEWISNTKKEIEKEVDNISFWESLDLANKIGFIVLGIFLLLIIILLVKRVIGQKKKKNSIN